MITCPQPGNIDVQPYYRGYTLFTRDGVCEIWHYASDRLVHVEPHAWDAMLWADAHPAIPKSGKIDRRWHELDPALPGPKDWAHQRAWSIYVSKQRQS